MPSFSKKMKRKLYSLAIVTVRGSMSLFAFSFKLIRIFNKTTETFETFDTRVINFSNFKSKSER